jgi:hypothetical protein
MTVIRNTGYRPRRGAREMIRRRWKPSITRRIAIRDVTQYRQIDLGHGVITPGSDNTLARMAMIGLPADLCGQSVLDIGAWDGAFSFEAERRGPARPARMLRGAGHRLDPT